MKKKEKKNCRTPVFPSKEIMESLQSQRQWSHRREVGECEMKKWRRKKNEMK